MAIKTVLTYPDEVLRQPCTEVDDVEEVKDLIQDLKDTCRAYRAHGLAAPQIGVSKRVFVTCVDSNEPRVFINPEIYDKEEEGFKMQEGCLSFPGVQQVISRFGEVSIKALDESGEEFILALEDLEAVAVQHENDHLDGVLFIDHVGRLTRKMMLKKLRKPKKLPKVSSKPSKRALARQKRKKARRHRKGK